MRLAITLIRDERKPFEETEIPDNESDTDHKTVSSDDCDEKEDVDDSPWEISSDSSNGGRPTSRDPLNASNMGITTAGAPAPGSIGLLGRRPTMEMPRILESITFTITCL
jgi:hypothetical protein